MGGMVMAELGRLVIHRGRDPFTPPQTKVDWVSSDIPGVKVPVMRYKYMNSFVDVVINGPDGDDVKKQFESCAQQATIKSLIAGLIAGYASGGSAALSAALATFVSSLDACVEGAL